MKKDTFEVNKTHLAPLHLDGLIGGLIALQLYWASLQQTVKYFSSPN